MFQPRKTVVKGLQHGATTSIGSAAAIQCVLELFLGVEIATEDILKVSGAIGVLTGGFWSVINWFKHGKKKKR